MIAAALVALSLWLAPPAGNVGPVFVAAANAARAGLPPVTADRVLTIAAQATADRIAREGVLTHSSLGSLQRFAEALNAPLGEILAVATCAEAGPCAERIQAAWDASPTHAAVVYNPVYSRIGVGVARNGPDLYVVEVYAGGTP